MRLENILALTHAKLINKPFVNSFENIVFKANEVKRGDLFIAFENDKIDEAVLNGAYGILFCKPTQITDSEIAWIKVENIEEALKRLLRFQLIDKNILVYESNEIVLKLSLQVVTEPNFIALDGDIKSILNSLWNIEHQTTILFSPEITDPNIFTKTIKLSDNVFDKINIIEQTLFETSFIYDDIFYERQLISPFFIPYLEVLLHLFKTLKINYRLRKFTPIEHFEAVFTNKKFEIKEFGTSDKVLIFENNCSLIAEEIKFLQKEATWAQILYVIPYKNRKLLDYMYDKSSYIMYGDEDEIINLLKYQNFHFALIIGTDKSILSKPISTKEEITLFDFN